MGCVSAKCDACITHHSKELYIENEEKRFQIAFPGYKDTHENKIKRREASEQYFLEYDRKRRQRMRKKISDKDIIQRYKNVTAEM